MASPTAIVAYLALFGSVGFLFLFANLLIGKFLRPHDPHPEKLEIYECGEPTIGSSFVQFDLRFYVVALVFIVFDVEVAFLFPLSTVFGKATHLADPGYEAIPEATAAFEPGIKPETILLYQELGVENPQFATEGGVAATNAAVNATGQQLAWATFLAINVFFIVLLIGFAYEWKTGAFDWVRALRTERSVQLARQPPPPIHEEQPTLSM